jgi:hypothetical protein
MSDPYDNSQPIVQYFGSLYATQSQLLAHALFVIPNSNDRRRLAIHSTRRVSTYGGYWSYPTLPEVSIITQTFMQGDFFYVFLCDLYTVSFRQ